LVLVDVSSFAGRQRKAHHPWVENGVEISRSAVEVMDRTMKLMLHATCIYHEGMEKQVSASDEAYLALKERIISGEIGGGVLISEGEMAAEFGVSRTPVREAFLRLQSEGWMQLFPKRGALVAPIAPGELRDVVDARILLESDAVAQLGSTAADLASALREIVSVQRELVASGDISGFTTSDADFHNAIVAAGRNRLLGGFYSTLRDRQRRMTASSVTGHADRAERAIAQHEDLIELAESGDADGFRTALAEHIRDIHRDLL
jgi:DNA-binding GntR family transcriptional regulator